MPEEMLKRYTEFILHFGVKIDDEFVYIHDGHNSLILNPDTEWKEFLGCSIWSVAYAVAKETNKKLKWT